MSLVGYVTSILHFQERTSLEVLFHREPPRYPRTNNSYGQSISQVFHVMEMHNIGNMLDVYTCEIEKKW
jgi:hypothetical protein